MREREGNERERERERVRGERERGREREGAGIEKGRVLACLWFDIIRLEITKDQLLTQIVWKSRNKRQKRVSSSFI